MRRQAAIWILLLCGGALAVVAIGRPDLVTGERGLWVLYMVLLLAFVGSAAVTHMRASAGGALRNIVVWLVIVAALAGGYRLWETWGG